MSRFRRNGTCLALLRARRPRAAGAVARAAGPALIAPRALLGGRLLLAEALDQHGAALAVGHEAGALLAGRLRPVLVAPAAIMPAQRGVVLPPRIAAARAAGRFFGAF